MEPRTEILIELQAISPLVAGIGSLNPYQVPQGFFEGFSEEVLKKIRLEKSDARRELESLSPLLSGLSRKLPYEIPENYFNELSEQSLGGAKAIEFVNDELENLSPLMSGLKSKQVYSVPDEYFQTLADNILKRVAKPQPAKVVSIGFGKKIVRYAAAAILVGVMVVGGWFIYSPVSDASTVKVQTGIRQASDAEILNFIQDDEVPGTEAVLNTTEEMNESDMKAMLADVSDSELEQFAKENVEPNNTLSN